MRTARRKQYILVITDRFIKLACTVPIYRVTAEKVMKQFQNHWVLSGGPPRDLIAYNDRHFTSELFQDVCKILNMQKAFKITHQAQIGQIERFTQTIFAAYHTYNSQKPRDWDIYTSALTYDYNYQSQIYTALEAFELVLSNRPGHLTMQKEPSARKEPTEFKQK